MSYHVRIEELHKTSNSLIKQIDTWKEQLLNVRKSLVAIVHMEMGGEAAEALRAYVQEVHITAMDWILGLLDTYRSSLILYVDGYRSIEPDIQGEISQKVLEEQLECLQREKADFLQTAENIEQIFRELNQYMDVDSVCLEDMEPCYDRAIQYAEQVRTQVGEYEETHRHDVDTIAEMMAYIEKFLGMHQLDGAKHILAYQPGSMAKLPEYQQAENLSALQRLYVEQVSDSVKEGLKHLPCGSAAEEVPASWCVLPVHGVVAAKGAASPYADGVLPHLTGKISDTIYLAAECVKSGAVSIDRLNAGVFRELDQLERQIQKGQENAGEAVARILKSGVDAIPQLLREKYEVSTYSEQLVAYIKQKEGCSLEFYNSGKTIGYGFDVNAHTDIQIQFKEDGSITEDEAERLLYMIIEDYRNLLNEYLEENNLWLDQGAYDAMMSIYYNRGSNTMTQELVDAMAQREDQRVLELLENFDFRYQVEIKEKTEQEAQAYVDQNPGLAKRREEEYRMYKSGSWEEETSDEE